MSPERLQAVYQALIAQQGNQRLAANMGNPYGIGNPPGSAVLPPEAYGRSGPPPGYTTYPGETGSSPQYNSGSDDSLPPAASGVRPGPAYPSTNIGTGPQVYAPGGPRPSGHAPTPAPYVPLGWIMPPPDYRNGGYPNLRGGESGDWRQNASRPPVASVPAVPVPQGAYGVQGQGGSFFHQSGGPSFGVPGGIGFNPGGGGQNTFGEYFHQGGSPGPLTPDQYAGLMQGSGWGQLLQGMHPHEQQDLSYQTYLANMPAPINNPTPPVLDQLVRGPSRNFRPAVQ